MYEDYPNETPISQEILQMAMEEALAEYMRDTPDLQQGSSVHPPNIEESNGAPEETDQNELENILAGLRDADGLDRPEIPNNMSTFFEDSNWAAASLDGAGEAIASSSTEIQEQQPIVEEGLDLFDYDTLVAFNRQFELDHQVRIDQVNLNDQADLNDQVNLNDQVSLNDQVDANLQIEHYQQTGFDQQIDLTHEGNVSHPIDLGPQLDQPINTAEARSEQEESTHSIATASSVNHLHIPSGSPYAIGSEQDQPGLQLAQHNHNAPNKKVGVRNTVTKKLEPSRDPTRSPRQYAGVKKAKTPKGKAVASTGIVQMEKSTKHPDPVKGAAEKQLAIQRVVHKPVDITLSEFVTEAELNQFKATAREMAREEAKKVYSRELTSAFNKAYIHHLEILLQQQGVQPGNGNIASHDLQQQGPQMTGNQFLMTENQQISFTAPGPSKKNAYPSPRATVAANSNCSQSTGQSSSHVSPATRPQANDVQNLAMNQITGFSSPQQNCQFTGFNGTQQSGNLDGLTYAQQHGQTDGFSMVQQSQQYTQQGHQIQTQQGQQLQSQYGYQIPRQQQVFYPSPQQNAQALPYYAPLAAPQQPTYQPQSQAQAVAQQYRMQQQQNQNQQQQSQMNQQVQSLQFAAQVQPVERTQQHQPIQQAQHVQQVNMYWQPDMQPNMQHSHHNSNAMHSS